MCLVFKVEGGLLAVKTREKCRKEGKRVKQVVLQSIFALIFAFTNIIGLVPTGNDIALRGHRFILLLTNLILLIVVLGCLLVMTISKQPKNMETCIQTTATYNLILHIATYSLCQIILEFQL